MIKLFSCNVLTLTVLGYFKGKGEWSWGNIGKVT